MAARHRQILPRAAAESAFEGTIWAPPGLEQEEMWGRGS